VSHPVIRRTESHFQGARGHSLLSRSWLAREPERVLLLVHGYGEHSGRYEHVGAWFAARGCAVHAYDQQGHGRSAGTRCHVRRFGDFHDDLALAEERVAAQHPGLPLFLVGHSMGGLIVASYARERRPRVAGVVLSGPLLALADELPRGRLLAARMLRWLAPRLTVPAGIDPEGLSRDPAVVRAYVDDPLVYGRMTLSLAAELFAAVGRTAAAPGDVDLPVLLLHGGADSLCPAEGSRAFHSGLRRGAKRLRVYPELRHEIFNEPEREAVFEDLLDWVRARADAKES
jgi:alpha-beta hydrolase superfamily lysophospholipase